MRIYLDADDLAPIEVEEDGVMSFEKADAAAVADTLDYLSGVCRDLSKR